MTEFSKHDSFKVGKFFEGEGPLVGWQVTFKSQEEDPPQETKNFLVVDAHQQTFGIRLEPQRIFTPKPSGVLVATLRKQAPTSHIPLVLKVNGDFWIPLQKTRTLPPQLWVLLRWSSPPECHVVAADGVSLVRKSQQGTYTKKKPLDTPIPSWPPSSGEVEILALRDFLKSSPRPDKSAKHSATDAPSPARATPASLSPEQKEARDRVARRLKTLKKSLSRYLEAPEMDLPLLERQAHALKANFHLLSPLTLVANPILEVEDQEGALRIPLKSFETPAMWLQEAFDELRRSQKRQLIHTEERTNLETSLTALAQALETLRTETLAPSQIQQILGTLQLAPKQKTINSLTKPHAHQPFRVFKLPVLTDPSKPPRDFLIHVGKSAMDSDQLVKHAKGNDLWLHAVGATGSHVIIPSAPFSEGAKQGRVDDPLIFAAAVLALYYSKNRDQKNQDISSGEVYFSRRHHIKKRKGMAPGLWQIDQAATLGIRYTSQDLERILNLMSPS